MAPLSLVRKCKALFDVLFRTITLKSHYQPKLFVRPQKKVRPTSKKKTEAGQGTCTTGGKKKRAWCKTPRVCKNNAWFFMSPGRSGQGKFGSSKF